MSLSTTSTENIFSSFSVASVTAWLRLLRDADNAALGAKSPMLVQAHSFDLAS